MGRRSTVLRLWNACLTWFGNLPLKTKLYMSFGWMCLFTVVLGAVSVVSIEQIRQVTAHSGDSQIRVAGQSSANGGAGAAGGQSDRIASRSQSLILSMLAGILVINFVMAWRLVHIIGDPIMHACKVLDRVSHRDMTVHADVVSTDEVGQMCEAVNRTVSNMHDVLALLKQHADALQQAAEDLADRTSQSSDNCRRQAELAQEVLNSTRVMADKESEIAQNSRRAATAGRESSEVAEHARVLMGAAAETMDLVASSSRTIAEMTSRLQGRSKEIGKFVTAIQEISEQTNLLALNASIEAARAGQQGRGFAVVAGEVRRLAERTHAATEEIAQMVRGIQDETRQTTSAIDASTSSIESGRVRTSEAHQTLSQIIQRAKETQSLAESTAASAEEQSETSHGIARHAEQVSELASSSLACSTELLSTTTSLRDSSRALSGAVHQFQL
jgi:methyl-accepting chemotaxis protein